MDTKDKDQHNLAGTKKYTFFINDPIISQYPERVITAYSVLSQIDTIIQNSWKLFNLSCYQLAILERSGWR